MFHIYNPNIYNNKLLHSARRKFKQIHASNDFLERIRNRDWEIGVVGMDRSIHNNSAITVLNGRKQIVGIVRQPPKYTAKFPGESSEISLGNNG